MGNKNIFEFLRTFFLVECGRPIVGQYGRTYMSIHIFVYIAYIAFIDAVSYIDSSYFIVIPARTIPNTGKPRLTDTDLLIASSIALFLCSKPFVDKQRRNNTTLS